MAIDPEIKAQLQADAEAALEDPAPQPETKQDTPPAKKDAPATVDSDVTEDEAPEVEEEEDPLDDEETDPDSDEEDPDTEDDLDDEEDPDEEPAKGNRSQTRIKELIKERNEARSENQRLMKQMLEAKTPAQQKEVTKQLEDKGWTPEQIAEGKRFMKEMGLDVEGIAAMQGKMKTLEEQRLMDEDRAELRTALSKTKSTFTEKEVMTQVQKWANHSNPKVQARASLDYPAILRLMKKTVAPATPAPVEKKKGAPKIPKGGSDTPAPQKKEEKKPFEWDPSDKRGSLARLAQDAEDALLSDE